MSMQNSRGSCGEIAKAWLNVIARSESDEAIQFFPAALDCFATLAMTLLSELAV